MKSKKRSKMQTFRAMRFTSILACVIGLASYFFPFYGPDMNELGFSATIDIRENGVYQGNQYWPIAMYLGFLAALVGWIVEVRVLALLAPILSGVCFYAMMQGMAGPYDYNYWMAGAYTAVIVILWLTVSAFCFPSKKEIDE